MYLNWFDDNPKRPATEKIQAAMQAREARYGTKPTRVLVNEAGSRCCRGGGRGGRGGGVHSD